MTVRVLLADDHPAIRAGIRGALTRAPGIVVVGEADNGVDALRLIEEQRPDVVVLDCRLPGLAGTEVAAWLQAQRLPTRVLALSAYAEDQYVRGMLQAGAAGYLLKEEALDTVTKAVQAVAQGQQWFSPGVMPQVLAWMRGERSLSPGAEKLSGRELQVLRLLARGWDNRRIAQELSIGEGTVKNHVVSIYTRLGLHSRAEAVAWAWEQGVMDGGSGA